MKDLIKESLKYIVRSKPFIKREINEVEYLYSLTPDELKKVKEQIFLSLFKKAFTESKFYSEFYTASGISITDINSLEDISKLPVLTKEMIKEHHTEMLTVPLWKVKASKTSGTTGSPITIYHSYKAIRLEQAYKYVRRSKLGFAYGENLASIRGNLLRNTFKLFVPVANTLYLSSYNIKESKAEDYFNILQEFKPKAVEGYPSSLYNLCLIFEKKGWKLNIPVCFTSSETLFPFQRDLIEDIFQTQVFDHYGCTERTISLMEKTNHMGYFEEPGYSINEYQDESVITTSLINNYFPLIRYEVKDIINVTDKGIENISGRKEDYIICKDGTKAGRLNFVFKGVSLIKYGQIIQKKKGHIEINVVPSTTLSQQTIDEILKNAYERLGRNNIEIEVNEIGEEDIIYTSQGKFNLVKSYLSDDTVSR